MSHEWRKTSDVCAAIGNRKTFLLAQTHWQQHEPTQMATCVLNHTLMGCDPEASSLSGRKVISKTCHYKQILVKGCGLTCKSRAQRTASSGQFESLLRTWPFPSPPNIRYTMEKHTLHYFSASHWDILLFSRSRTLTLRSLTGASCRAEFVLTSTLSCKRRPSK